MTILLAVACLPCLYFMWLLYKYDRVEKEPLSILLKCLLAGGCSAILVIALGPITSGIESALFNKESIIQLIFSNFITVALVEESCKFLFLYKLTWNNNNFNCSYDGLIYAVFVSLGFALTENIMYVFSYGLTVGLLRAVTAIPGHVAFGIFMGVHYSEAKWLAINDNHELSIRNNVNGVLLAIIAHGLYDFIASVENKFVSIVFIILLAFFYRYINKMVKLNSKYDVDITR